MPLNNKVTLQISLSPADYNHARFLLPKQLSILADQVDEILLTIDTNKSKGRFGENWEENHGKLYHFIKTEIEPFYPVKVLDVDYSTSICSAIASYFFGKEHIPVKDFRGGPFYAYFFGLYFTQNSLIFHLDSDIFLGGNSQTWVTEAKAQFAINTDCFIVSPLPGPPHPDKKLIGQVTGKCVAENMYEFPGMSTRIFMIDKTIFQQHKIQLKSLGLLNTVKALIKGNPVADLPERLMTSFMTTHRFKRIDFLGVLPGLWSLHPPYRTNKFYEEIPNLIKRIEVNDIPPLQYGFYDISDDFFDWSEAKEKLAKNRTFWLR